MKVIKLIKKIFLPMYQGLKKSCNPWLLRNTVSTSFMKMQGWGGVSLVPIVLPDFCFLTSPIKKKIKKKHF